MQIDLVVLTMDPIGLDKSLGQQSSKVQPHSVSMESTGAGRWFVRAVVGVALVTMGMGIFSTGSALDELHVGLVGRNVPINAGATDRKVIEANNSPTIAQNPTDPSNLAVANRIDTPLFSCALHVSFDAGASWARTAIPFPAGEELPERCFAPDLTFAADGKLYLSFVTLKGDGNVPNAGWFVSSRDGGRTLTQPKRVLGAFAFQPRIVADPSVSRRLYLSWLQADGTAGYGFAGVGYPVEMSRSDDGGATWAPPVRVNAESRQRPVAPSTTVGPGGKVYALYLDMGNDRLDYSGAHDGKGGPPYPGPWSLILAHSQDGGASWGETVVERSITPIERVIVFEAAQPSLAVDMSTGTVFVSYHDQRLGDADVWLWRSTDEGRTFSAPVRVNDTRLGDKTSQYLPALDFAGGRLDVVYYDRRSDASDLNNEVSFQFSSDGGKTFGSSLRLSDRPFDSRIGFGRERGMPDLGSRVAILSGARRTLAVWTDTRGGTTAANKQDIASALVTVTSGSTLRQPLRYAGLLVGAVGVAVLLTLVRQFRRRRKFSRNFAPDT